MPWPGWEASPTSSWLTTGRSRCAATTRWRASSAAFRCVLRRARGYVPLADLADPRGGRAHPCLRRGAQERVRPGPRPGKRFSASIWATLTMSAPIAPGSEAIAHFQGLLRLTPRLVAHDLHPGYASTAYARMLEGVRHVAVQHHHAHIASCLVGQRLDARVIGVAWDGTGYGTDGHVWGGEFLVADLRRVRAGGRTCKRWRCRVGKRRSASRGAWRPSSCRPSTGRPWRSWISPSSGDWTARHGGG